MAVSAAFYQDWSKAGKSRLEAQKTVWITRLTKAGKPSKMAEDTVRFYTVEEAEQYISRIAKLNPGREFRYFKSWED